MSGRGQHRVVVSVWLWVLGATGGGTWVDALEASGVPEEQIPVRARVLHEQTRFIESLRAVPEAKRGARLLQALHERLFRSYSARATSLTDILDHGRYNCVSSAVLYAELAAQLDLEVRAEIHTTHARVQVQVEGRWRVVETTTAFGFDPDAEQREQVAARLGTLGQLGQGRVMPRRALVAAIYVNRGIFAQELGRTKEAEQLYARGIAHADDPSFRRSLETQRAGLGLQLAFERFQQGRWAEAFATLLRVYELSTLDPELQRLRDRNLEAYAQRWFREAPTSTLANIDERIEPLPNPARQLVRGHAAMELGQRAADGQKWGEARAHFERASRLLMPGSPVAARVAARNAESMANNEATQTRVDEDVRARRLAAAGRLEEALSVAPARPWLYMVAGLGHLEREETEAARRVFDRCIEVFPEHQGCAKNLLVALQRAALSKPDCEDRESLLRRFERLAPDNPFPDQARLHCWTERARGHFEAGRIDRAFEALLQVAGSKDAGVVQSLRAVFARWREASACEAARAAAARLRSAHGWSPDLGACAP